MSTTGLRLRDPILDPIHVTRAALEIYAAQVLGDLAVSDASILVARLQIRAILRRVNLVFLPRIAVRLGGTRLIIKANEVVWAGPCCCSGIPFYRQMTNPTGDVDA